MAQALSVQADEAWGQDCLGYAAQIDLCERPDFEAGEQVTRELLALHAKLSALDLSLAWRPTPRPSAHVSVYTFIPGGWEHPDKHAVWADIAPRAASTLESACAGGAPFELTFRRVHVFPRAIVALAEAAPAFLTNLRACLRKALLGSLVPAPSYDVVHTTVARFAVSGVLSAPEVAAIESLSLSLSCRVTELRVVRERSYPSLVLDELARFPLR